MKESDIRKYAGLMQELGLTGLEITEDNHVVRLERNLSAPVTETIAVPEGAKPVVPESKDNDSCKDHSSVTSPIVGVFYAAPAENAEPFVSVGDRVSKGTTLCIIEAMKLMNEITADEDGVIVEICVRNGQVVEYGTELFRLQKVAP